MSKANVKRKPAPAEREDGSVTAGRAKASKPTRPREPPREEGPIPTVARSVEEAVGVTVDELTALYVLDGLKGFGPQKLKELHGSGLTPRRS
jgi:hypothetical protein